MVAGERAAARVGAVHPRREPDDDEPRRRIAERRHRLAPVRRVVGRDGVEKLREPRAAPARRIVCGGGAYFWHHRSLGVRDRNQKKLFRGSYGLFSHAAEPSHCPDVGTLFAFSPAGDPSPLDL